MRKFFATAVMFSMFFPLFAQEIKMPEKPQTKPYVHYSDKNNGFWIGAGGSCAMVLYDNAVNIGVGGEIAGGYRFNEFLKIGAGVAPVYCLNSSDELFTIAFFFDIRGNFIPQEPRMFSPYWSFDLGYDVNCKALYLSPTLGLKFGALRNDCLVGVFYAMSYPSGSGKEVLNAVGVKLMYEF